MRAALHVDELNVDPHPVAAPLNASLQHVAHITPSTKYSCSGLPPMFAKGRTTRERRGAAARFEPPFRTGKSGSAGALEPQGTPGQPIGADGPGASGIRTGGGLVILSQKAATLPSGA
jgi:hypothetical protein